jgi:hypothetical protein
MVDLADASLWAPVRQIETTDPVVGGPPNLLTGAGMSNVPHQLLANRTKFLRDQLDVSGMGLNALTPIANLDTLQYSGTYYASSGATGAPIAATIFNVIHQAGNATTAASQFATSQAGDRTFFRRKVANVWQAWSEIWSGVQATNSQATSGYQRLPSGVILQWADVSNANNVLVSFPIAFPTTVFAIVLGDANGTQTALNGHIVSYFPVSLSQFRSSVVRHDGDTTTSSQYSYFAIGN